MEMLSAQIDPSLPCSLTTVTFLLSCYGCASDASQHSPPHQMRMTRKGMMRKMMWNHHCGLHVSVCKHLNKKVKKQTEFSQYLTLLVVYFISELTLQDPLTFQFSVPFINLISKACYIIFIRTARLAFFPLGKIKCFYFTKKVHEQIAHCSNQPDMHTHLTLIILPVKHNPFPLM